MSTSVKAIGGQLFKFIVGVERKAGFATTAMDGLREQKALLRKAVRAQLAKLSADEINQQ